MECRLTNLLERMGYPAMPYPCPNSSWNSLFRHLYATKSANSGQFLESVAYNYMQPYGLRKPFIRRGLRIALHNGDYEAFD